MDIRKMNVVTNLQGMPSRSVDNSHTPIYSEGKTRPSGPGQSKTALRLYGLTWSNGVLE